MSGTAQCGASCLTVALHARSLRAGARLMQGLGFSLMQAAVESLALLVKGEALPGAAGWGLDVNDLAALGVLALLLASVAHWCCLPSRWAGGLLRL